jgi:hypothetical protein
VIYALGSKNLTDIGIRNRFTVTNGDMGRNGDINVGAALAGATPKGCVGLVASVVEASIRVEEVTLFKKELGPTPATPIACSRTGNFQCPLLVLTGLNDLH